MPTQNFTTPGSSTFDIPAGAINLTLTVAGAEGGSGGTDGGPPGVDGGNGGEGRVGEFSLINIPTEATIEVIVGTTGDDGLNSGQTNFAGGDGGNGFTGADGGAGGDDRTGGSSGGGGGGGAASAVRIDGGDWIVIAGGGGGGGGGSDSNFTGPNSGGFDYDGGDGTTFTGSATITPGDGDTPGAPPGGDGGGPGGGGGGAPGGVEGAAFGNDQVGGAPPANRADGGLGGESAFSTAYATLDDDTITNTGNGFVILEYDQGGINSFDAAPNPVDSSLGVPEFEVNLSWSTSGGAPVSITSTNGDNLTGLAASDSITLNNLPQSEAGVNSPISITYTLNYGGLTADVTVNVTNDDTPTSITEPTTTSAGGTALDNLEPDTFYETDAFTINGVDMNVPVETTTPGVNIKLQNGASGSSVLVPIGEVFYMTFTSIGFDTSYVWDGVSTNAGGLAIGTKNPLTVDYTVGSELYTIDFSTRGPIIEEAAIDFEGSTLALPFPDIDTVVPNPSAFAYIETGIDEVINTVEVEVPIKVDDELAQAQIRDINGDVTQEWITPEEI